MTAEQLHNNPQEIGPSSLLEDLVAIQNGEGLSDRGFAPRLGVTHAHWSHIRSGRARMGRKCLSAVMSLYPQLAHEVLGYLHGAPRQKGPAPVQQQGIKHEEEAPL